MYNLFICRFLVVTMPPKRIPLKHRIELYVAIIAFCAAIIAAVVGILPTIIGSYEKKNNLSTETPVVFVRYDDPANLFSIEYPPDFVLGYRQITNEKFEILFEQFDD